MLLAEAEELVEVVEAKATEVPSAQAPLAKLP